MPKSRVARRPAQRAAPKASPSALNGQLTVQGNPGGKAAPATLADVTLSWRWGDCTFTVTGKELSYLLVAATAAYQPGFLPRIGGDAAMWGHRLLGLGALIYPDAGVPIHEADGRALLDDILEWAAGHIIASDYNLEYFAGQCALTVAPGAGFGDVERVKYHGRDKTGGA